jgi:two-component system response regulator FlrC
MELGLQAKLLRVLQEREVERLGGRKTIKLDVRVLATSNRDLKAMATAGEFREDLYYRINVFPLTWPALHQRPADILPLARHLLAKHAKALNMTMVPKLDDAATRRLLTHRWPGNVRELDNVIQRALILRVNDEIGVNDIIIDSADVNLLANDNLDADKPADIEGLGDELKAQEHVIILETLNQCQGSRKKVAEKLGISARTLRYKMAKMRDMGIQLPA